MFIDSGDATLPRPAWRTDIPVALRRNVLRLTAPNAGVMTGPGTNSYLVGTPHAGYTVIDPGPADALHVQRLWDAATFEDGRGGNIVRIVCTHSHPDHAPAARPLQALCSHTPAIAGMASAPTARPGSSFAPDTPLTHQARLSMAGPASPGDAAITHTLQALHTPGHAANHLCLVLLEDGLLFSGDHILSGSTTVIDPPDGNMGDYLDSLDLLAAACDELGVQHILPAHGHPIPDPLGAIAALKAHRLRREAKIAAVMRAHPQGSLEDWLPLAYDDVPAGIWPVARRSLLAHVQHIESLLKSGAE